MSEEKLNQEEREDEDIDEDVEDLFDNEVNEAKDSNDSKGDDSEDASKLSDDALTEYNKNVGKNYKSWDDVAKREKEADKAFAKGIHKKEVKETPSINDEVVEELLLTKHPEAENVLDELKDTAKQTGKSILKLYRESKYFQGEAKSLDDAKKSEEEAKSKISKPANGASSEKKDISSIKPEEVEKLSPSEKLKWIELQAEKERNAE